MRLKLLSICLFSFVILAVGDKPIINLNVEYSAISYFNAKNPGGNSYKNVLRNKLYTILIDNLCLAILKKLSIITRFKIIKFFHKIYS